MPTGDLPLLCSHSGTQDETSSVTSLATMAMEENMVSCSLAVRGFQCSVTLHFLPHFIGQSPMIIAKGTGKCNLTSYLGEKPELITSPVAAVGTEEHS